LLDITSTVTLKLSAGIVFVRFRAPLQTEHSMGSGLFQIEQNHRFLTIDDARTVFMQWRT
jgi:hypothetical protein